MREAARLLISSTIGVGAEEALDADELVADVVSTGTGFWAAFLARSSFSFCSLSRFSSASLSAARFLITSTLIVVDATDDAGVVALFT